jgi:hypothetical protein
MLKLFQTLIKIIFCLSLIFLVTFSSLKPAFATQLLPNIPYGKIAVLNPTNLADGQMTLAVTENDINYGAYLQRSLKSAPAVFGTCAVAVGIFSAFLPPASVTIPYLCGGLAFHGTYVPWLMSDEEYNQYLEVIDTISTVSGVVEFTKTASEMTKASPSNRYAN